MRHLFLIFDRMSIVNIVAREILDSRGNPTVEVDLHTGKGWKNKHVYKQIMCKLRSLTV